MFFNLKLSREEKFIIKLFFLEEIVKEDEFKNLDLNKLIIISSSHLMLPALYVNLKKKKYLKYFPKDFNKYISKIYYINLKRNKILINELNEISDLLDKNNIKFFFLKGSYFALNQIYNDLGVRMIGDIDLIVNRENQNKIN